MLNGTLRLHDVDDVEAAANRVVEDWLRQKRAYLRDHDREDLIAYIVGIAWELSLTYDPNRGWSFSKLLYQRGSLRIVDWYRARFQDLRADKPALPLSLDAPTNNDAADGPGPLLIDTLAAQPAQGDLAADLDSDSLIRWLRTNRNSSPPPPDQSMGRSTDHRAPHAAAA
jgi:hypothetical protein